MRRHKKIVWVSQLQHQLDEKFGKGLFHAGFVFLLVAGLSLTSCQPDGKVAETPAAQTFPQTEREVPRTPAPPIKITITDTQQKSTLNDLKEIYGDTKVVRDAYFAKRRIEDDKIFLDRIQSEAINDEVCIVVDTFNIPKGTKVQAKILEKGIINEGSDLKLVGFTSKDHGKTGTFLSDIKYYDTDELEGGDLFAAIFDIQLKSEDDKVTQEWLKKIASVKDGKLDVCIQIDVPDLDDVIYCGNNTEDFGEIPADRVWLDMSGKWFEIDAIIIAPWMDIAWKEYDKWVENQWTEKYGDGLIRAQEYVDISSAGFSPANESWCACFVDWVLKTTNKEKGTNFSTVVEYPASSQNYVEKNRYPKGKIIQPSLNLPAYGLIAILHSSGWSGHAGLIINFKVKNGKNYIYLLGGNQNDKVCVQEFEVYDSNKTIKFKTARGTIYTLKGYVYPEEYDLESLSHKAYEYTKKNYVIESAISTN